MDENKKENLCLDLIVTKCIDCGQEFRITPSEQKFYAARGYTLPKRCEVCRQAKQKKETFVCIDCGREFKLNNSVIRFYERNGLHIPKRCEKCRVYKRERNAEQFEDECEDFI